MHLLYVLCVLFALSGCSRAIGRISPEVTPRSDLLNYKTPLKALLYGVHGNPSTTAIKIEKSAYRLTVLNSGTALKSYPVVFGCNPVDDKMREGDCRTPEGKFHIDAHYHHRLWSRFMRIDYPTRESWARFKAAKRAGKLKPRATIGGYVGIHGVPDGYDDAIDTRTNWTLGCISLKTDDVKELYDFVRVGTPVTIVH